MSSKTIKRKIIDVFLIGTGVLSAGFGLVGFLLPNAFIDGGAVGISLLIAEVSPLTLSILLVLVNTPFIIFGLKIINKEFTIKTALGIIALAVAVAVIPYPQITHDKLLVAVFGGFFLGGGIGLAIRGGGVIDGTEVLAIYISRKTGLTIGDIILIMNIIIFSVGAYLLSIEIALYSILTYMVASRTIDFIIEGIEEYTGIKIISEKTDAIRKMIVNELGWGVTIIKGERGFNREHSNGYEIDILFLVITRLEISKLKTEVYKIDEKAFMIMSSIKDTKGGMMKKRSLQH